MLLELATLNYKPGHYVLLSMNSAEPKFRKEFVSTSGDNWYIVVQGVQPVDFICHFHAYEVSLTKPAVFAVCTVKELANYHPLYCHLLYAGCVKKECITWPYHFDVSATCVSPGGGNNNNILLCSLSPGRQRRLC